MISRKKMTVYLLLSAPVLIYLLFFIYDKFGHVGILIIAILFTIIEVIYNARQKERGKDSGDA